MSNQLIIPTERPGLVLRRLTPEDASAYFEAIASSREHLSQFDDVTASKYPDLKSVADSIANPSDPDKLRMGIWDGSDFAGSINLTEQGDGREIGYWLDERFTGNGYATLAATALIGFARRYHERIYAEVDERNTPSTRVLEHAGLKRIAQAAGILTFELTYFHVETLRENEDETVALIALDGTNRAIMNHGSDTEYHVVAGEGMMRRDDEAIRLLPGTSVTIESGTPYYDRGCLLMLATSRPPFNPETVEEIEK